MAVISSSKFPLGTQAPDFELPDVRSGKAVNKAQVPGVGCSIK